MNTNNRTTLKNVWKKSLAGLLSLSILASMSTSCFANEKHEQAQAKKTTKAFTKEDVKGWGLSIASIEAAKLGIDTKDLVFKYNKEDMKLIRKLSSFFDTEEKRRQMAEIHDEQKANEVLTKEESLIFENYNEALAELKKMLRQKIKTGAVLSSFEHHQSYEEEKTETSSADVNAEEHAEVSDVGFSPELEHSKTISFSESKNN